MILKCKPAFHPSQIVSLFVFHLNSTSTVASSPGGNGSPAGPALVADAHGVAAVGILLEVTRTARAALGDGEAITARSGAAVRQRICWGEPAERRRVVTAARM